MMQFKRFILCKMDEIKKKNNTDDAPNFKLIPFIQKHYFEGWWQPMITTFNLLFIIIAFPENNHHQFRLFRSFLYLYDLN